MAYAEHYPEHVVTATGRYAVSEEVGFMEPPSDDVENQAGNPDPTMGETSSDQVCDQ